MLLASAAFVAAGVFLAFTGDVVVGWMCITFFGACALVLAWQFLDRRPRLVFSELGVMDRTLGVGVIPWREIENAYVKSVCGHDFICLELRNPEMFVSQLGALRKTMQTANRKLGFTDISINLSGLPVRSESVLELILKKCQESAA